MKKIVKELPDLVGLSQIEDFCPVGFIYTGARAAILKNERGRFFLGGESLSSFFESEEQDFETKKLAVEHLIDSDIQVFIASGDIELKLWLAGLSDEQISTLLS